MHSSVKMELSRRDIFASAIMVVSKDCDVRSVKSNFAPVTYFFYELDDVLVAPIPIRTFAVGNHFPHYDAVGPDVRRCGKTPKNKQINKKKSIKCEGNHAALLPLQPLFN